MADVKISGLPASTVPLAGTEVLPIVQGGSTKQVSIANVTAGRSVAALSVITPTIQAEAGSAGGTIKNGSGVAQMQWGSGGASNFSLEVATNINPANAAVSISPTGTGTVTINPATASTMNNVVIGGTTPAAGTFTSLYVGGSAAILSLVSTGTGATYTNYNNNGGSFYVGRENSASGAFGLPAYSSLLYSAGAYPLIFHVNGAERVRMFASGGVSIGNTTDPGAGGLKVSGLMYPQQAATAPSYVKGAIYFDTTLNKLRVGGATDWETITSV
jgi:hypothetical protein